MAFTAGNAPRKVDFDEDIPLSLEERISRGLKEHGAQQFHDAKDTFQAVVRDYPYCSKAWMHLGSAEYRLRAYLLAEKSWKEGLRLNPMDIDGYANLGSLLIEQQRFDEAIYYWKVGLQIDEKHKALWLNLANIYKKLGRMALAHNLFQKYVQVAGPRDVESQKIQRRTQQGFSAYKPNIQIATLALKQGNLDHARRAYDKALEYYVGTAKDYRTYGAVLYKMGRFPEAKHCYLQAIELDETDIKSFVNLGVVEEKNSRWVDALWAYTRGLRSVPESDGDLVARLSRRVDAILKEIQMAGSSAYKTYLEAAVKSREQFRLEECKMRLIRLQELMPHTESINEEVEEQIRIFTDMFDPQFQAKQFFYQEGEGYLQQADDEGALHFFTLYQQYFPEDDLSKELVGICEALEAQVEAKKIADEEDRKANRGRVSAPKKDK